MWAYRYYNYNLCLFLQIFLFFKKNMNIQTGVTALFTNLSTCGIIISLYNGGGFNIPSSS